MLHLSILRGQKNAGVAGLKQRGNKNEAGARAFIWKGEARHEQMYLSVRPAHDAQLALTLSLLCASAPLSPLLESRVSDKKK